MVNSPPVTNYNPNDEGNEKLNTIPWTLRNKQRNKQNLDEK